MKHFKQFCLVILVALTSSVRVLAYDFVYGGLCYTILTDVDNGDWENTVEVAPQNDWESMDGYNGDVYIPESFYYGDYWNQKIYRVVAIGDNAFNHTNITSINAGYLDRIGSYAFCNCSELTEINISRVNSLLDEWGVANQFSNCPSLMNININENGYHGICSVQGVLYNYEDDNSISFVRCPEAKSGSFHIAKRIKRIPPFAFENCKNITDIDFPSSLEYIIGCAFLNCTELKTVILPDGLIGLSPAFYGCSNLESIHIGKSLQTFYYNPTDARSSCGQFFSCTKLQEFIVSPENPYFCSIDGILYDKSANILLQYPTGKAMETFTIPTHVKQIFVSAFETYAIKNIKILNRDIPTINLKCGNITCDACHPNLFNLSIPIGAKIQSDDYEIFKITSKSIKEYITINFTEENRWGTVIVPFDSYISDNSLSVYSINNINKPTGEIELKENEDDIIKANTPSIIFCNSTPHEYDICGEATYGTQTSFVDGSGYLKGTLSNMTIGSGNYVLSEQDGNVGCKFVRLDSNISVKPTACYLDLSGLNIHDESLRLKIEGNDIAINDKFDNYSQQKDKYNVDIAYTRTFNSTNWQPLYIPFNMNYEEWSEYADVAEIRGIYAYDDSEGTEHTVLAFHRLKSGELKPNTPYVIKPKQTGEVAFTCTNKTLKAAENGSVWCASTRKKYTLTGIYEEKSNMDGVYAMSGGAFYLGDSNSPALSPFRFYLTVEDIDNGYGSSNVANAPRCIQIAVDDEVTGSDEVLTANEKNESYYDLSGRKVMQPTKGIYIRNGKKVLIK